MNDNRIQNFYSKSSKYSISNCTYFDKNLNEIPFNIINKNTVSYINLIQPVNIYLEESKLYTEQYNETVNLSGSIEYNLPLIYGNIRNTINTRYQ
jgi:hypothetical protein